MELSGGVPSAQFENPGDFVKGEILALEELQQTDMETGEPVYWDVTKQRPKMMIAVTLRAPDHKDANEDGEVVVYLSGGRFSAVKKVTRKLDEGGILGLKFTGLSDQPPKVKGWGRAKLFEAYYEPPKASVSLGNDQPPF